MVYVDIYPQRAMMSVCFEGRLQHMDFRKLLVPSARALSQRCGRIRVLLLDLTQFGGWEGDAAIAALINFIRRFGAHIDRVVILGGRAWRAALPSLARLFAQSELRHFEASRVARSAADRCALSGHPSRSASPTGSCV